MMTFFSSPKYFFSVKIRILCVITWCLFSQNLLFKHSTLKKKKSNFIFRKLWLSSQNRTFLYLPVVGSNRGRRRCTVVSLRQEFLPLSQSFPLTFDQISIKPCAPQNNFFTKNTSTGGFTFVTANKATLNSIPSPPKVLEQWHFCYSFIKKTFWFLLKAFYFIYKSFTSYFVSLT